MLSPGALYHIVRSLFTSVAKAPTTRLPKASLARFEQASTHWIRHTFATRALDDEVPLDVVQEILGHQDINTTRQYAKTKKQRLTLALRNPSPAQ